jgi:hypothetical protein
MCFVCIRCLVVALLYILSNGVTQLDEVIMPPYPSLSIWITPMKILVNRNQSYQWLAGTLSQLKSRITLLHSSTPGILSHSLSV